MRAARVMMVAPKKFAANPETIGTNSFQQIENSQIDPTTIAREEFFSLQKKIESFGTKVFLFEGEGLSPDEIFPNNWISVFGNKIILYPMQPLNRRLERRKDIVSKLQRQSSTELIDLTYLEKKNLFLEGTGSLILDHDAKIAYACRSPRTSLEALKVFSDITGYSIVSFDAHFNGAPIYHTNVMMSLGENLSVVCFEAIPSQREQKLLRHSLQNSGKEILSISLKQMKSFAGNCLQIKNQNEKTAWIMSKAALQSFTDEQISIFSENSEIISSNLKTIETLGGGSARCMICELFF